MEFPKTAKQAIAKAFFDKEIAIIEKRSTLDEEGGAIKSGEVIKRTFTGNVRFLVQEEQQNNIGLVKRGDIQITCSTDTEVEMDDLLRYAGTIYVVTSILPSDSHLTILGDRWVKQ